MLRCLLVLFAVLIPLTTSRAQDEPQEAVYSGPQVGEKLPPLAAVGVYGEQAGQDVGVVMADAKGADLLVFVHELTRPSVALTRVLMDYAAERRDDDLRSAVIFLADDRTAMTNQLQRARHAMPQETLIVISKDGREGPGAYGLNRNVTLTVLVAKDNVVQANFALVQPSVQADAPKIFAEVVKLIGGEPPQLGAPGRRRAKAAPAAPQSR